MKDLVDNPKAMNRAPARLDLIQSLTGLALALFMWTHLILVSSILLGKDAMLWVSHMMEGRMLTGTMMEPDGHGFPILVTLTGIGVFTLFIVHAAVAVRKFPGSWKQYRVYRQQMQMMKHSDTNLWFWQAVTGFIMFFLGSVHLYIMTTHPDLIGPYASADRFVDQWMWPLYFVLLIAVELHATIGMYRLAVKWGILDGKEPRVTRKRLKALKNALTVFFLVIGMVTFAAYVKIGLEHRDKAGQRYYPNQTQQTTIDHSGTEQARGEQR